jgi:hypothetical protein
MIKARPFYFPESSRVKRALACSLALAAAALPCIARADLSLDLKGYFRSYAVYTDNDTVPGPGANTLSKFSFMRDDGVAFTGQTALDNGLTVGVYNLIRFGTEAIPQTFVPPFTFGEQKLDFFGYPGAQATMTDQTYAYFQGQWGRINLGSTDGAAYLLQVAAPAADPNIDGLRPTIQGFDVATWNGGSPPAPGYMPLGYDNADFPQAERLTYLTPKWSGFQAGISWAAVPGMQNPFGGTYGQPIVNSSKPGVFGFGGFRNLMEAAGRWDGRCGEFDIAFGGGLAGAALQSSSPVFINNEGSKALRTWDGGLAVTWHEYSAGAAYHWTNDGISTTPAFDGGDRRTWDFGLGWDKGPWHAGASFYDDRWDPDFAGDDLGDGHPLTIYRETVGGGYAFAPGMSLRGAVSLLQADDHVPGNTRPHQTEITLGTDIKF